MMKIRWIGQSGYIIKTSYAEIMIDPYLSDVVNRVANRPRLVKTPVQPSDVRADAIICTHNHLDHLDVDAIEEMDRKLFFATTSEGAEKLKSMGVSRVKAFKIGEKIQVNNVEIEAVYAAHTVEAFGVIVRAEGKTLYFSGDTLFDEHLYEVALYHPDVTFICINGKLGNMNVDEAVLTAKKIGAKVNVPNHYGMFASNTENPELFTRQMDNGFIMDFDVEYDINDILQRMKGENMVTTRRKVLELFETQKEFWEKRAAEGIETYRKGDASITITDGHGNVIPNAKVKVSQKNHEFRFGANLFLLDELETEQKNETYKKIFADTFNMATLPFYWNATEPKKGQLRYAKDSERLYRRPPIDLCIEYCEENGIEPREHGLAYENSFPKWLYDADIPEVKREMERRYREISERYADKIRTIEVTNEMAWSKGKVSFYDDPEYVEYSFKLAEQYFPNNQLVINEETEVCWEDKARFTDKYYSYIDATLLKGARIDAIGMQYHSFPKKEEEYDKTRKLYNPELLYKHMDLYAKFGKPLQVTEVTIPAYSNGAEDEAIQAELIEHLYSIWFSHPNVEQIVYWNVVDGYAHLWDPDPVKIAASQGNMTIGENYYYGGLLRFDMSPKPAYYTIKNLIEKKWHTETELVSASDGTASFRGFYGEYDVEIEVDGKRIEKTINLTRNGENQFTLTI